jgi:hypothetical protein
MMNVQVSWKELALVLVPEQELRQEEQLPPSCPYFG